MSSDSPENHVLEYNRLAMEYLKHNDFKTSLAMLKQAEDILNYPIPNQAKLLSITLNNLGCYYKRTNKPTVALHYLWKALEVGTRDNIAISNLAGTHLNVCAIESQLGKHSTAIMHAKRAIKLLSKNFEASENTVTTLVLAYHNAGVEYEFLSENNLASSHYMSGYELAFKFLGEENPLTKILKTSYKATADHSSDSQTWTKVTKTSARSSRPSRNTATSIPYQVIHKYKAKSVSVTPKNLTSLNTTSMYKYRPPLGPILEQIRDARVNTIQIRSNKESNFHRLSLTASRPKTPSSKGNSSVASNSGT